MKRILTIASVMFLAFSLGACGSTNPRTGKMDQGERILSGALIGFVPGVIVGVPMLGVIVGGAVGGITTEDHIDFGPMIWDRDFTPEE